MQTPKFYALISIALAILLFSCSVANTPPLTQTPLLPTLTPKPLYTNIPTTTPSPIHPTLTSRIFAHQTAECEDYGCPPDVKPTDLPMTQTAIPGIQESYYAEFDFSIDNRISRVVISPGGKKIAVSNEGGFRVYEVKTQSVIWEIEIPKNNRDKEDLPIAMVARWQHTGTWSPRRYHRTMEHRFEFANNATY